MLKKITKQQLTLVVVGIAVVLIVLLKFVLGPKALRIDPLEARSRGDINAQVKIVEFIDFECPACANGSKLLREKQDQHPGKIHVQVKYFPLSHIHRHAMPAALYSECAARQGKFWPLHEQMMDQQAGWRQLLSADPIFGEMARQAGVNMEQLNECLADEKTRKAINDERALGQSMGVQSTPSYFINGKMVVGTKSLLDELNNYFPSQEQVPPVVPAPEAPPMSVK